MGRKMRLHEITGWDLFLELIALIVLLAIGVITYLIG